MAKSGGLFGGARPEAVENVEVVDQAAPAPAEQPVVRKVRVSKGPQPAAKLAETSMAETTVTQTEMPLDKPESGAQVPAKRRGRPAAVKVELRTDSVVPPNMMGNISHLQGVLIDYVLHKRYAEAAELIKRSGVLAV